MKFIKSIIAILFVFTFTQYSVAQYQGGEFRSWQQFKYGRFSARIKTDWGSGLINAFFLYDENSWKNNTYWREIDFEILGRNTKIPESTVHFGWTNTKTKRFSAKRKQSVNRFLDQQYYWYHIEWTPRAITTYIRNSNDTKTIFWHRKLMRDFIGTGNGKTARINPSEFNARPMDVRFNFWAMHNKNWSGLVNKNRIGKAQLKIDRFVYHSFAGYQNGNWKKPKWKWEWADDFDQKNHKRWNWNIGNFNIGNTRIHPNNVNVWGGNARIDIKWSGAKHDIDQVSNSTVNNTNITVYPNPFSNNLTVDIDGGIHHYTKYKLVSILGSTVLSGKIEENQPTLKFPTSRLSKGMYQLHVTGDSGSKTFKLVRE